jgi:acyl-CoA synthetase (NDP forming)
MDETKTVDSLRPFFEPESVAIIGASRTPGKGGHNIIRNLQQLGYEGEIYPINPSASEILGLTTYGRISETPEVPDLALIIIPPSQVMQALHQCIDRGVKGVIIETSGFGEIDEAGAETEKEIRQLAQQSGVRVMGPNSIGTINPWVKFDASFALLGGMFLPESGIKLGGAGIAGQTGLFTGVYLPLINTDLGISKIACLGNKADVDECDMLAYLGADPETKVIAMYLESIKDGRRFLDLSRNIIPKKPIIVLKSAVTERGATVSASHTGSIAGADGVYDAAFRQAGIIRAESFNQLFDITRAFVHSPLPRGNRIAIINVTGAGCVVAVDACIGSGLKVAELSPETVDKIKGVYPDWWVVKSPVDVWTAVESSGFEKAYTTITRSLLEDEQVDAVVVVMGAVNWVPGKDIPEMFRAIKEDFPDKPLLAVNPLGDRKIYDKLCHGFQALGIPSYFNPEEAVKALAAQYTYYDFRRQLDNA